MRKDGVTSYGSGLRKDGVTRYGSGLWKDGVTRYGSGLKKDGVNQWLEFESLPDICRKKNRPCVFLQLLEKRLFLVVLVGIEKPFLGVHTGFGKRI